MQMVDMQLWMLDVQTLDVIWTRENDALSQAFAGVVLRVDCGSEAAKRDEAGTERSGWGGGGAWLCIAGV